MPKDFFLWKYSIIFFICCSHPCLIKIRFQSSNCMDPRVLVIILFLFIVVHQICIFKQVWDKTCTNIKEHFDNILIVHLGKLICASLACCAIFADVPPTPSFISMNLTTYPSNFENFLQGLVHQKDMHPKFVIVLTQRFINQTWHHVQFD